VIQFGLEVRRRLEQLVRQGQHIRNQQQEQMFRNHNLFPLQELRSHNQRRQFRTYHNPLLELKVD
jgi:hypothetical protein